MADYGVNIAVAVKNTEAITALTRKIKLTTSQVGQLNNFLVNFNDWRLGPAVVNSVDNFSKALKDARDNLNSAALGSKEAADAARDFARAQDLANDALREQAELLAQVRNEGRSGTLRGGTQYSGPIGPGFGGFPATKPEDVSVPAALRSRMRPQSVLPSMETTVQAGKIASDMEDVYASIVRLTEKAHQEEAEKLQILRQGTKEVEELAQKYRAVNETRKTEKQLQLEIRRSILETKQAAAEEARIANQGLLDRLRNLEAVGAERREQFIQFNKEENEKRQIRMRELDFEERLAKVRERKEQRRRATSSALIGGAFPLLFGQGLGAAAGGAAGGFGGGMIGGEFGFGVSLIGTQIGSMIDQLGQKAIDLGKALDPLTADTEAVIDAVGKADTEFALLVEELEAAGRTAEALQLVTDELEKVVGEDGVEAIELFSAGIRGLQNDFTVFITQVAAVVAQAINDLTGQTKQIQEIREVGKIVQEARKSDDPRIKAAIAELDAIPDIKQDKETQQRRINTRRKIADLVKQTAAEELKASRDAIARVATEEKRLTTLVESDKVARETRYLLAAQIQLEEAGSDLLDEKVVAARKRVIQEEYLAAYRQAEGSEQGQLLAGDQRRLALLELDNDIAAARTKETERLAREAQKTTKERNTQITQALTLEQKFAAELKQREAATELEADKARIAAEFEDRMRRIKKIGDDTLTKEAQRLANQIKITDEAQAEANARLRSLQAANALKDRQAGFQMQLATLRANAPGAFSGPFAGSERAAFLGGLEMQFELERRNREIEAMQGKVSAGKASQKDVDNLVALRDQYALYQTQVLEATVAQQKFADALALTQPVTDSLFDSLMAVADGTKTAEQAFADFLRSIASMLFAAAKQIIATYIAMGIARMFSGLPPAESSAPASKYGTVPSLAPSLGGGKLSDPKGLFTPPTLVSGKALGGAVGAGTPYLVGEKGPELFVPGAMGNIVPNKAMGGTSVVVNVDASNTSAEGDTEQGKQLGKVIGIAVRSEILKQQRPGGLLA